MLNPDFVQADRPRAESIAEEVERESMALQVSWYRLGRVLDVAQREHVPMTLGLSWVEFVNKHCRCSETKAARALASYRAVKELPEEKIPLLGEGVARQLARPAVRQLPESKREALVELAISGTSLEAFTGHVRKELGLTKEVWVSWRVPGEVEKLLEEAVQKLARIFAIDLIECPERRVLCLEYMACFVNQLNEEAIKRALAGRP